MALRRRSIAALLLLALGLGASAAVSHASPKRPTSATRATLSPGTWCGGTRWRLMTFSDVDRKRVNLHSEPTSIAQVAALHPPTRFTLRRSTPFERQVWRMQTVLDRYRIASNGEIVLVLYSIASGQYMNAYLPNPDCLGKKSRDRSGIIAARAVLHEHCPPVTDQYQLLGATIDIAGVGFWNPQKTTRGALQNGAELRPVTNFRLIVGCGVG
jgi:hypothetical protein